MDKGKPVVRRMLASLWLCVCATVSVRAIWTDNVIWELLKKSLYLTPSRVSQNWPAMIIGIIAVIIVLILSFRRKSPKRLLLALRNSLYFTGIFWFLAFVYSLYVQIHTPTPQPIPLFSVAIETKIMVPSPLKDNSGTGLWGINRVGASCYARSVDTALLIRIRNLQAVRVMITAYNVYGIGGELHRIRLDLNEPFRFVQKGRFPIPMQIPPGSRNMNGGFIHVPFQDMDFSRGYPVQAELLDRQIGEHYIEPNDIVRGWAFFEYPSIGAEPVNLTIKISDDLGHAFSSVIPDEAGNPQGDTLPRIMSYGNPIDLSSCIRLPHPPPEVQKP
jgi:hypothetical protein